MANSTAEDRFPNEPVVHGARDRAASGRVTGHGSENARKPMKPLRRRANDITSAIGLKPITGLSGPKIAY